MTDFFRKISSARQSDLPPARTADSSSTKRRQLFIRVHNETLSVAMRIGNKDYSPLFSHACDATPTPTGRTEIVSD
jgi:hypothetical protein